VQAKGSKSLKEREKVREKDGDERVKE